MEAPGRFGVVAAICLRRLGASIGREIHFSGGRVHFSGGEGIRTPGTLASTAVFKTAAFDHSATPPEFGENGLWAIPAAVSRGAISFARDSQAMPYSAAARFF